VFSQNGHDVAFSCWINWLENEDFFILGAVVDFRDCVSFIYDYVAKLATGLQLFALAFEMLCILRTLRNVLRRIKDMLLGFFVLIIVVSIFSDDFIDIVSRRSFNIISRSGKRVFSDGGCEKKRISYADSF
jgi:hypothetical protein